MDSDYTEPQEEDIQSQTDDTGIQPWEPPKVSSTGLLTPNYGILEVAPGPRQNVNFDPMSAFDNATTMHYNQSAAPVDDMLYPGGYQVPAVAAFAQPDALFRSF
ncbi:hypothetical protein J1614_005459 [Plenodomus biglobosus]|nr:hypothetical protein J1614_005459 [Plenodomus biglobosus]